MNTKFMIFFFFIFQADDDKPRGFDRRLDPERIIGATDSSGGNKNRKFLNLQIQG